MQFGCCVSLGIDALTFFYGVEIMKRKREEDGQDKVECEPFSFSPYSYTVHIFPPAVC